MWWCRGGEVVVVILWLCNITVPYCGGVAVAILWLCDIVVLYGGGVILVWR